MAPQFTVEMDQVGNRAQSATKLADFQAVRAYIENIDCTPNEQERLTLWAFSQLPISLRREIVQNDLALPNMLGFHGDSHHGGESGSSQV